MSYLGTHNCSHRIPRKATIANAYLGNQVPMHPYQNTQSWLKVNSLPDHKFISDI